jgi:hypothetical protein
MSDKRARYTGGSQTGVDLSIPFGDGDFVHLHIPYGGELPSEVAGRKIPATYRDSLLEQTDNWSEVRRATGDEVKGKTTTATADTKEG